MFCDVAIVGGGIVGLATAMNLVARDEGLSVLVLEKENEVGLHQSGHNSGVIHSGIYYEPESLKAVLCRDGCAATKQFCREEGIPFEVCGKLLIATKEAELPRLDALYDRAIGNSVRVRKVCEAELAELEPEMRGLAALLVPDAGITNYRRVCQAMAGRISRGGGEIRLATTVSAVAESADAVILATPAGVIYAKRLIACAGLQSDRVAKLAGLSPPCRIVPFRGEYYSLPAARAAHVNHLIYPVPDPALPFLGIHLTRMVDGNVTVGPNAVIGFAREGYERRAFNRKDAAAIIGFSGTWLLARRFWRSAISELAGSVLPGLYLAACQRYYPSLGLEDLTPWPAGIRAQAVMKDGSMVQDFLFMETARMLHVLNAPSPAATSAIPIGRMIVERLFGEIRAASPVEGGP